MIKKIRHCYAERDGKKGNKENVIDINILQAKSNCLNMFLVLELCYNLFLTMKAFRQTEYPSIYHNECILDEEGTQQTKISGQCLSGDSPFYVCSTTAYPRNWEV